MNDSTKETKKLCTVCKQTIRHNLLFRDLRGSNTSK